MIEKLREIKALLWDEWDPIGVNDGENAWDDEYDSYALGISKLLDGGADEFKIAEYLKRSVISDIGLSVSDSHDAIAKKIMVISEINE